MARLSGSLASPLLPTAWEVAGCVFAFAGMVLLLVVREAHSSSASSATIRDFSLSGDLCAFAACIALAVYLLIGGRLRKWMGTWTYALPVTTVSAVVALALSLAIEPGTGIVSCSPAAFTGWLCDARLAGLTVAAAVVPGIVGHTLANYAMAVVHPQVLAVAQLVQPGIAGFNGWLVGVQGTPSAMTLVAAPLILAGILLVVGGRRDSPLPSAAQCLACVKRVLRR